MRAKNVGRESSEISLKTSSFICTRISCPKNKGEKKRKNNFSRKTRIVRTKLFGKISSQKSAKTRFLYSHEYREQKMGGKKPQY